MKVGDLVKATGGSTDLLGRIGLVQGFRMQSERRTFAAELIQWATVQWTDEPEPSPYTFYVPVQHLRVISKG